MIDNQYYLTNILGRGASSKVFLASDCNDETFAIKVVNVTDKLPYKAACVMAVREAEILESIEGHPNIIKAFDTNLQGVITHKRSVRDSGLHQTRAQPLTEPSPTSSGTQGLSKSKWPDS